jgi:ABC-type multidrug transport system fused ATPase/permease subunit
VAEVWFFVKYLHANSGKNLIVALIGMIAISLLEGIGILLLLPMLSLSGIIDSATGASVVSRIFWFLPELSKSDSLVIVLGVFISLATLQYVFQRILTIRNLNIQLRYMTGIRVELYGALLRAGWDFFIRKRKSDLVHSLTEDFGRVSVGVTITLQFLAAVVFTIIQLGLAFYLSPELTAMIIACGAALAFYSRKHVKRSKSLGERMSEIAKSYMGGISDQLNGMKEIKSNTIERSRLAWFREMVLRVNQEQLSFARLLSTSQFVYKLSSAVFIAAFIWLFYSFLRAETGQLLLVILIFSRLWPRFNGIQSNLQQIASSAPPLKALISLRRECEEAKEVEEWDNDADHMRIGLTVKQKIEFRDVHFHYSTVKTDYALSGINVHIPANRMTAIVGRSGAGKSTFIDLLMGLLQPVRGTVLLDETPLTKENLLDWRSSISYVPQDPFLFNGSIRDNLLLMQPDAGDELLWEALETASLSDFASKLPNGLDTQVGDRGIRLSGGERQRLVLARALLRSPSVLVLDEATSALDTENENNIQEAIQRMKGKITVIVVAHRLNTIRNADQVIVLDEGSIVQAGQFQQLANEKKGLFRSLLGYPADVS